MDRKGNEGQAPSPLIPEAVTRWIASVDEALPTDFAQESGIYGYSFSSELGVVEVMVGSNTDLSDKERFPDDVEGTPIFYDPGPAPELQ